MVWPMIAAAAVGAIGSIAGGREAAKGGDSAMAFEEDRMAQLSPYINAGASALPQFREGIEDIPNLKGTLEFLRRDPGYQFQLEQGLNAVEGSAAARNNLLSGNTLKELNAFGQGIASEYTDRTLNRGLTLQGTKQNQLLSLMNGGLSAAGRSSALPQIAMAQGQNGANTAMNVTNSITSGIGNMMLQNSLNKGNTFAGGNMNQTSVRTA